MFELPKLDFAYHELEPFISAVTVETHHSKHHAGYTAKFNAAIKGTPLDQMTAEDILSDIDSVPEDIQTAVINNGGGYFNHKLYWETIRPNPSKNKNLPTGALLSKITESFGSFTEFQEAFTQAAQTQFASGWAWLVLENEELKITQTANQNCPLSLGQTPLLCVDVWEHAYYLDYKNLRPSYLENWWFLVDWDQVQSNLNTA